MIAAPVAQLAPGSRAGRLRASHSYGLVLALVVALFAFAAIAPDDPWAASLLLLAQCGTFVTALWTSGLIRAGGRVALGLTVIAAAAAILQLVNGGTRLTGVIAIMTALFVVVTILVVALGVMDQGDVNAQSVRGAICVYVLLGLFFTFVYGAIAALGDGPLFAQGADGTRAERVYFSYVTLGTLGYGDYTAAGDFGRMVAVVEALVGQLYLVTVVALLISRIGVAARRQASSRRDDVAPVDAP